jgi:hypothetical protein
MRKGDISNDIPQRLLVTTDVFIGTEVTNKKRFKVFKVPKVKRNVRKEILSYLFLYTNKRGVTLELVSFDFDEEELLELTNFLDQYGTNPFRYHTSYSSVKKLVGELPYRPEVVGVLDIPTRLLQYGHWGLDINSL